MELHSCMLNTGSVDEKKTADVLGNIVNLRLFCYFCMKFDEQNDVNLYHRTYCRLTLTMGMGMGGNGNTKSHSRPSLSLIPRLLTIRTAEDIQRVEIKHRDRHFLGRLITLYSCIQKSILLGYMH